jgi:adenine-specific DNA methylase
MAPIFMLNHTGDPNWIKGFHFEGDTFLQGGTTAIGSFSGDVLLNNPPLNQADFYEQAFVTILNDITGYGSFTVTANSVGLSSSAQNGDYVFAWSGSISNGTGALENNFGLSAGNTVANVFAGQGLITEVVNIRNGL